MELERQAVLKYQYVSVCLKGILMHLCSEILYYCIV